MSTSVKARCKDWVSNLYITQGLLEETLKISALRHLGLSARWGTFLVFCFFLDSFSSSHSPPSTVFFFSSDSFTFYFMLRHDLSFICHFDTICHSGEQSCQIWCSACTTCHPDTICNIGVTNRAVRYTRYTICHPFASTGYLFLSSPSLFHQCLLHLCLILPLLYPPHPALSRRGVLRTQKLRSPYFVENFKSCEKFPFKT